VASCGRALVASGFALGVLELWMSGLGGGADTRLPAEVMAALAAKFDVVPAPVQTMPMKFACPSVVMRNGDVNSGATEIFHAWETPWRRVELISY
jgi:hypothetical protein